MKRETANEILSRVRGVQRAHEQDVIRSIEAMNEAAKAFVISAAPSVKALADGYRESEILAAKTLRSLQLKKGLE